MEKIVLVGAGGHAKSVIDTIENEKKYEIAGFVSNEEIGKKIYKDYFCIAHDDGLDRIIAQGIKNAFICIGYMGKGQVRNKLYESLCRAGFKIPSIIDASAIIGNSAIIGEGAFVGKRAIVNANAIVDKMAIINSGAVIEHDTHVGEFSHIAVSAVCAGNTQIGCNTLVGANATIIQGVSVGSYCIVGAGAVVVRNVENHTVVCGVPARRMDV